MLTISVSPDRLSAESSSSGQGPCVLALGFFDGVHLAHRALLSRAREIADREDLPLSVFTFRSEDASLKPGAQRIYSTAQKLRLLEENGVDTVFLADFQTFFPIPADSFVRDFVIGAFSARMTVCGFNFRFGNRAAGDAVLLSREMTENGRSHLTVEPFLMDGKILSSTLIREALAAGDLLSANRLLGAPYFQSGTVIHGDGRGHTLGVPTVNLPGEAFPILPAGVYATRTRVGNAVFPSVTNLGSCPTFGERPRHSETFLIGYEGSVYGREVTIEFLSFLRQETVFSSGDDLKKQIKLDILTSKKENITWQDHGQN